MLRSFLRRKYAELKTAYMREANLSVPDIYRSSFIHLGGSVEVQYIFGKFSQLLKPGSKILIVGVMGGRDYFYFLNRGFKVTALDLGQQPLISPITIHNIEDPLPFPDESFDAVLVSEVLEHLPFDVTALRNVRAALKTDGFLWVSIPYYHDEEEGHLRIHSPISARRLLSAGGFEVIDYLERPALMNPSFITPVVHVISWMSYFLFGKTAYGFFGESLGGLNYYLSRLAFLRFVRKHSRSFGGYFNCKKSEHFFDHVSLNKTLYTQETPP